MLASFGLIPTKASSVQVGERFGRLHVLAVGQIKNTYRYFAVCKCDCGSELIRVRMDSLRSGVVVGCGCVQRERTTRHGHHKSPHYDRWRHMLDRCYNAKCGSYPDYGGRGISVCDRWHDIENYLADLPNGFQPGMELDRIDNDGHYEPGNVRWVTRQVNTGNRRSRRLITFNGKTQSLTEWADETRIDRSVIWTRLNDGWAVERALTQPSMGANERMAVARHARWGEHKAKPKPQPRALKTVRLEGRDWTISDLSDRFGIDKNLLRKRLFERGWPVERAIQKPGD